MSKINNKFDICIIGSGPAGICLALEYSKLEPSKKIVIVEFGKFNMSGGNKLDDSIINSNIVNHHDPYECTNKGFGGSSASWGGRCVMYDEIDFIERDILNGGCTWDINFFNSTKKFISKTTPYFECGEPVFDLKEFEERVPSIAEGFVGGDVTDSVLERWSMPTRFGKRYRKEIKENENIVLKEGYQAKYFSDPNKEGKVKSLEIIDTSNFIKEVIYSDNFIVSCGTFESTRLLLSNSNLFKGLKKVPSALGKYYQGHLSGKIASVKFYGDPKKTDYGFIKDKDSIYLRRRFQFSRKFLQENNLLNTAIWLDNPLYHDPSHRSGAMSLMYLIMITPFLGKKLAPPAIVESITKGKVNKIGKHLLNILKDFPFSLTKTFGIFYQRYCVSRKLPGIFLYNSSNIYALHFHSEQIPTKDSYMELKDDHSLKINYLISDEDIKSVIKIHEKLDEYLRSINCGELIYWYPKEQLHETILNMSKDGIHQSGTARIGRDEKEGVVDDNLKLYGTSNVYVCSGAVFPTSGQANTTFFLSVLAVRLANYLNKKE